MESRKVIVHYKKQSVFNNATGEYDIFQRPPFETVESNITAHEKIYGSIIKEIVLKDNKSKLPVSTPATNKTEVNSQAQTDRINFLEKENERLLSHNVNLTVAIQEKKSNAEIDLKTLIEYFIKKDKTPLSIAKYLNITVEEVNKYLPEMV